MQNVATVPLIVTNTINSLGTPYTALNNWDPHKLLGILKQAYKHREQLKIPDLFLTKFKHIKTDLITLNEIYFRAIHLLYKRDLAVHVNIHDENRLAFQSHQHLMNELFNVPEEWQEAILSDVMKIFKDPKHYKKGFIDKLHKTGFPKYREVTKYFSRFPSHFDANKLYNTIDNIPKNRRHVALEGFFLIGALKLKHWESILEPLSKMEIENLKHFLQLMKQSNLNMVHDASFWKKALENLSETPGDKRIDYINMTKELVEVDKCFWDIYKALHKIPVEEKKQVIELLKGSKTEVIAKLISLIYGTETSQREPIITHIKLIFPAMDYGESIAELFLIFQHTPKEEWNELGESFSAIVKINKDETEQITIFSHLLMVSPNQRKTFVDKMIAETKGDANALLNAICALCLCDDLDEQASFFKHALPISRFNDSSDIFVALQRFPISLRDIIVKEAKPIFDKIEERMEVLLFLRSLYDTPKADVADIIKHLNRMFEPHKYSKGLIFVLSKIPLNERASLIDSVKALNAESAECSHLRELALTPKDQRQDVLEHYISMKIICSEILKELRICAPKSRRDLVEQVLLRTVEAGWDQTRLMKILNSRHLTQETFRLEEIIHKEFQTTKGRELFLHFTATIDEEDLRKAINIVKKFFTGQLSSDHVLDALKEACKMLSDFEERYKIFKPILIGIEIYQFETIGDTTDIPIEELGDIISRIHPFVQASRTMSIRKELLKTIYTFLHADNRGYLNDLYELSKECNEPIDCMVQLIKEFTVNEVLSLKKYYPEIRKNAKWGFSLCSFCKQILGFSQSEREEIFSQLASVNCSPTEWNTVLSALANTPQNKRSKLFESTLVVYVDHRKERESLFSNRCKKSGGDLFYCIYNSLKDIPEANRPQILDDYRNLFGYDLEMTSTILITLNQINANQKSRLLEFLSPLFQEFPDRKSRLALINTFNTIPEDSWNSYLNLLKKYENDLTTIDPDFISILLSLGIEKAEELLSTYQYLFRKETKGVNKRTFLTNILLVPPPKRATILQLAASLLITQDRHINLSDLGHYALLMHKLGPVKSKLVLQKGKCLLYKVPFDRLYVRLSSLIEMTNEDLEDILLHLHRLWPMISCHNDSDFQQVIQIIAQVPKELRTTFCSVLSVSLRRVTWGSLFINRIQNLSKCDINDLNENLEHLDMWIPDDEYDSNLTSMSDFFGLLRSVPKEKHPQLFQTLKSFSFQLTQNRIIPVLSDTPVDKWGYLIDKVNQLSSHEEHPHIWATVVNLIKKLDPKDIEEIIQLRPFIKDTEYQFVVPLLESFLKLNLIQRKQVIDIYNSTIWPRHWEFPKCMLATIINLYLKDQLELLEKTRIFSNRFTSAKTYAEFIDSLLKLNPSYHEEFTNFILSYPLNQNSNFIKRLEAFKHIPRERFKYVKEATHDLIRMISSDKVVGTLLLELNEFPENEFSELCEFISPYLREVRLNIFSNTILPKLKNIPRSERKEIMEMVPIMINNATRIGIVADIIEAISLTPLQYRKELPQLVADFNVLEGTVSVSDVIKSFAHYSVKSPEMHFKKRFAPLLDQLESVFKKIKIFSQLSYLPKDKFEDAMLIGEKANKKLDCDRVCYLFDLMSIIPSTLWNQAFEHAINNANQFSINITNSFFADPTCRDAMHEHLLKLIEKHAEDRIMMDRLSARVIEEIDSLRLSEENPIFQRAIEIRCIMTDDANNKRNPYFLHQNLKQILTEEEILNYLTPVANILEIPVVLDLATIRANAIKRVYRLKDLPTHLTSKGFHECFKQLYARLKQLPYHKHSETFSYIRQAYSNDPEKLEELFLKQPTIINLLAVKDYKEEVIESNVFHLYTLMRYVLDQNNELKTNQLLTDREERLLQIACSIGQCPTGLRDGIVSYQYRLPIEYRISDDKGLRESEAKVSCIIDALYQKMAYDICAAPKFLGLIAPNSTYCFGPHQTLFLLNRLHKQLGIRHRLIFDFNSNTVNLNLVEAPLEVLMKAFFTLFDLNEFIKSVKIHIAEALRNNNVSYMNLIHTIETAMNRKLLKEEFDSFVEFDDEYKPQGVTNKGALYILLGTNFLKRS